MENTYSVYYDCRKIQFLTGDKSGYTDQTIVSGRAPAWQDFERFIQGTDPHLLCVGRDPARLFREFAGHFTPVYAAGGLVADPTGYWLFIFRKGRWDLPKGMIEEGEEAEMAAIREVQEECGISRLYIVHPLPPTYHVYPYAGDRWALKKTQWFFMKTKTCCRAEPQISEGISKAAWKDPAEISEVLQNTYGNIRELLQYCKDISNSG